MVREKSEPVPDLTPESDIFLGRLRANDDFGAGGFSGEGKGGCWFIIPGFLILPVLRLLRGRFRVDGEQAPGKQWSVFNIWWKK